MEKRGGELQTRENERNGAVREKCGPWFKELT